MVISVSLRDRLRLPLVAAPMLTVSGPDVVAAACSAGVIGAFPTANCRSVDELDDWLGLLDGKLDAAHAPIAANLIVHRSNRRLEADLEVLVRRRCELVITSVGSPAGVVDDLHGAGTTVWSDVATIRHAERAIEAGADGLILLTAGAGGQTGAMNPFAFVREVRRRYAGTVVLAGGIGDGASLAAARVLGADLGYAGTRFLATRESLAAPEYKAMVTAATSGDIVLTDAVTGLPASFLRATLPEGDAESAGFDVATTLAGANGGRRSRWQDAWSAGHVTGVVDDVPTVAELVDRLALEYAAAGGPA
ncbi:nitronate monooxygenase [Actinomycetospora succinea]